MKPIPSGQASVLTPMAEILIYHDPEKDGVDTEYVTCLTAEEVINHVQELLLSGLSPANGDFSVILSQKNTLVEDTLKQRVRHYYVHTC